MVDKRGWRADDVGMSDNDRVSSPLDLTTAMLVRRAFLPLNPNKMRGADPGVVQAAKDFIAVVESAERQVPHAPAEIAEWLAAGWLRYIELFGQPPHGTAQQLAAMLELCGELKR